MTEAGGETTPVEAGGWMDQPPANSAQGAQKRFRGERMCVPLCVFVCVCAFSCVCVFRVPLVEDENFSRPSRPPSILTASSPDSATSAPPPPSSRALLATLALSLAPSPSPFFFSLFPTIPPPCPSAPSGGPPPSQSQRGAAARRARPQRRPGHPRPQAAWLHEDERWRRRQTHKQAHRQSEDCAETPQRTLRGAPARRHPPPPHLRIAQPPCTPSGARAQRRVQRTTGRGQRLQKLGSSKYKKRRCTFLSKKCRCRFLSKTPRAPVSLSLASPPSLSSLSLRIPPQHRRHVGH